MMRNTVGMKQPNSVQAPGVFFGDSEFKTVPSERLLSSIHFQRDIDMERVLEIASDYDENKANPPKISLREGVYRIMDGAHTLAATKVIHEGKPFDLLCRVYHNLTEQQEADLFASQHHYIRKVPFKNRLRAEFTAEKPSYLLFKEITEKVGLTLDLSGQTASNTIGALAKAWSIYSKNGPEFYEKMLRLIVATWQGSAWSMHGTTLGAVAAFMKRFPDFDEQRFIKYVSIADENLLIRNSTGIMQPRDIAYAVAIAKLYNTRAGKKRVNVDLLLI